jgi:hypothetical protein
MIISIEKKDMPKHRDMNRVAIIGRKKGAHSNRKKNLNKYSCRSKITY